MIVAILSLVRVGAVFPQLEIGSNPDDVARYARGVEEAGYDHLIAFDHVLGASPDRPGGWSGFYTHRDMFHEPLVLFGYLAAIAPKLELAPAVIVLPQRQTALVAKQAAQLDVLTKGKFRLGVGIGWNTVEYEALGERFTNRARRIEEQIALLRRLWTEEVVDFEGKWHRVTLAGLNPMPVQRPIPLWMGGRAEAAVQRIARIADGWFTHLQPSDEGRAQLERFRGYVAEAGRDPRTFPIEGRISALKDEPEVWIKKATAFHEMGFSHIELTTERSGFTSIDQHLDALKRFRELVGTAGLT